MAAPEAQSMSEARPRDLDSRVGDGQHESTVLHLGLARCPFCAQSVVAGNITVCHSCHTPHHAECWRQNEDRCCIFACSDPKPAPLENTAEPKLRTKECGEAARLLDTNAFVEAWRSVFRLGAVLLFVVGFIFATQDGNETNRISGAAGCCLSAFVIACAGVTAGPVAASLRTIRIATVAWILCKIIFLLIGCAYFLLIGVVLTSAYPIMTVGICVALFILPRYLFPAQYTPIARALSQIAQRLSQEPW